MVISFLAALCWMSAVMPTLARDRQGYAKEFPYIRVGPGGTRCDAFVLALLRITLRCPPASRCWRLAADAAQRGARSCIDPGRCC